MLYDIILHLGTYEYATVFVHDNIFSMADNNQIFSILKIIAMKMMIFISFF